MKLITNRDDLKPDMTPGVCTHVAMARHLGGDASRWSCMDCGLEVGTDDLGRPLRALHPLWPLTTVPEHQAA
ncbi:hypothetical protein ACFZAR_36340 [Streptomyces sp. NPDC008222]|uniref:hypothetical protein n=1 Tax=Streptomyces sp. NPDC008222 TaxID=3364820 RepID=UPI0036E5F371